MKVFKFILIVFGILIFTSCSERQLHAMYNDKQMFMTTPSVDEFDKVRNLEAKPTYDEYRKR